MKIVRFIFVCLFIVIIASPLVFLDRKSIVSETEKRTLAVIPRLNIKDIAAIPAHIDNYMNDRFGFRNDAITMMNYFNYYVLRKKHNS
ncbi:MAG: hypothetical protein LBT13_01935, partial [Treponema sp.]|nr:hypothetical protein [Treponema sp.]